jgi:cellulose synthase/poly-beta-1,6-N-acetylglucosamine synthase-like glycosyltransferase
MDDLIIGVYCISQAVLFIFGSGGVVMMYYYFKHRHTQQRKADELREFPAVTLQLPVYNERYVVGRLIDAVCHIAYVKENLEIQVLDDSTDETTAIIEEYVRRYRERGFTIKHIRRRTREGYKAGALREGLKTARGEFIAIFDADFVPQPDFLHKTIPYFLSDQNVGMVQTRWGHLNNDYSLLTRVQAMALDGHFVIEQNVRNKAGLFINFNGTGGVWRKACILDAGNWEADTLTEDLDLSYRAQLRGWKFVFLGNVTSPAELPPEINALRNQQFRWTKGAVETARKILLKAWRSGLPLEKKIHVTFHLANTIVFPFIVLTALLNVPLVFIKHRGGYETYFEFMTIFVFAFAGLFLFYLYSQKDVYPDWRRRMLLFPLFMAASIGLSLNNTKAVMLGLFNKRTEFIRTPKYQIVNARETWVGKHYSSVKVNLLVVLEGFLSMYCFYGVLVSIRCVELATIPFQLLFASGYGAVAVLSVKHAWTARKIRREKTTVMEATSIAAGYDKVRHDNRRTSNTHRP